jgi:hypothetical protein
MTMPGHHHHEPNPERPAVHGMLMVGEARVLLSHLPMFHAPHNQQIVLEASLSAPSFDPQNKYVEDRSVTQTRIYTWVPKPFVLSDLLAPRPTTMVGTIFRGHFERGGVAITADDVEARVQRVLYSRRLVPSDPPLAERRYVMFGSPSEPFLAHVITRPPDFDQVTAIQIAAPSANWLAGWKGAGITLKIDGVDRTPNTALREGDQVSATRLDGLATGSAVLTVRREFYLERAISHPSAQSVLIGFKTEA